MSNAKVVMGQAANTLVKPLEVEDVFSTYLYEGNGSTQTITNGIDLDGEGGLVWLKNRDQADNHRLHDTVRGNPQNTILTNLTLAAFDQVNSVTGFNNNGFDIGSYSQINTSGESFCSWTFRKAPKFFDIVTWTGDGVAGRTVSHNLGSVPGMIIVKSTSLAEPWCVYHKGLNGGTTPQNYHIRLTTGAEAADPDIWNNTAPTSSAFTTGANDKVNANNQTYVAYLFAHNDGDGEFGPDGDADIIKCGSYTGNGSTNGPEIDLGFEPQWIMIKNATASQSWWMFDTMRGIVTSSNGADDARLRADGSVAEDTQNRLHVTSTGFKLTASSSDVNDSNTFIYIAIRRGTKVPESGTEVFGMDVGDSDGDSSTPEFVSGFPVDAGLVKQTNGTGQFFLLNRLNQGATLYTDSTQAENTSGVFAFDYSDGFYGGSRNADYQAWMWKRAPKFFDVVAYTGDGTAGRTVSHNLTVAPEMMWVKRRNGVSSWITYWEPLGATKGVFIDTNASFTSTTYWNDTAPTDSVFSLGSGSTNTSSATFIAYLFASLPGISKVGSYTGNGTSQTIDCGFTSGARFVLIKNASENDNWYVFDSVRGIVSGADPYLRLNLDLAEQSEDFIDPASSGFSVSGSDPGNNKTGNTYIFYAIA